jgi:hypothetical protein
VQDDALLLLIVDDAPGVASIRVAAFQQSVLRGIAKLFEATNFGAFIITPIGARMWRNGHHRRPPP